MAPPRPRPIPLPNPRPMLRPRPRPPPPIPLPRRKGFSELGWIAFLGHTSKHFPQRVQTELSITAFLSFILIAFSTGQACTQRPHPIQSFSLTHGIELPPHPWEGPGVSSAERSPFMALSMFSLAVPSLASRTFIPTCFKAEKAF